MGFFGIMKCPKGTSFWKKNPKNKPPKPNGNAKKYPTIVLFNEIRIEKKLTQIFLLMQNTTRFFFKILRKQEA